MEPLQKDIYTLGIVGCIKHEDFDAYWDASREVRTMWTSLHEIYHSLSLHTISNTEVWNSEPLRQAVRDLADKYGPLIWCRQEHRPWLARPGSNDAKGFYKTDLFYDDHKDRLDFFPQHTSSIADI
jgi:hypothetical protein